MQVGVLAGGKADQQWVEQIAEWMHNLAASKADQQRLAELAEQVGAAGEATKLKADIAKVSRLAEQQSATFNQLHTHKLQIVDMERKSSLLLEEAQKRLPAPWSEDQLQSVLKEGQSIYDALYVDFEDIFRGSREAIKSRLSVYLPYVKQQAGRSRCKRVLDLGCGRGEWIELLGEHGYAAVGTDSNSLMVSRCRELGLLVEKADGLEYVRAQKTGSFGVVSAFHVVEHTPMPQLIPLLDEALRVLRSGGLLILETPNPVNVMVGSCNFYYDPTHLHPSPPAVSRFLVEARGFVNAEVVPLHPVPDFEQPPGDPLPRQLPDLLYGSQDYAILARKA